MRGSDTTLALRWIRNVEGYARLIAEADKQPMVRGSTGQPAPNPIYGLAFKIEEGR